MGAIIGVVVGYALGARGGEDGWAEIEEAWRVIRTSDEVRDLFSGGFSVLRGLLARAGEALAGSLGGTEAATGLRPVA